VVLSPRLDKLKLVRLFYGFWHNFLQHLSHQHRHDDKVDGGGRWG
jgi:hypothetical protein